MKNHQLYSVLWKCIDRLIDRSQASSDQPMANSDRPWTRRSCPEWSASRGVSRRSSPKPRRMRSRMPAAHLAPHFGNLADVEPHRRVHEPEREHGQHREDHDVADRQEVRVEVRGLLRIRIRVVDPREDVSLAREQAEQQEHERDRQEGDVALEKRITGRDQRAVVMRCTATIVSAARGEAAKKSQLKCKACHARSASRNRPAMNTAAPMSVSTRLTVVSDLGSGLLVAASNSSRVGTGVGWRLTARPPVFVVSVGTRTMACCAESSGTPAWRADLLVIVGRRDASAPSGSHREACCRFPPACPAGPSAR